MNGCQLVAAWLIGSLPLKWVVKLQALNMKKGLVGIFLFQIELKK